MNGKRSIRVCTREPREDDPCSWRGLDVRTFLEDRFGKSRMLSSLDGLLHRLGDESRALRSKHRQSDPDAIAAVQRTSEELAQIQAEPSDPQAVPFFQDECCFGQRGMQTRVFPTEQLLTP